MKKTVALILTVLMMLTLASCVKEVYDVEITANGGIVKHELIITRDVYDSLVSMGGDLSSIEESGGKLTFYEEDGVKYVKFSLTKTFDTLEALNAHLSSLGASEDENETTDISDAFFENIEIEADEEKNTICLNGKINVQEDVSSYTSCEIILNFPGRIVSYNIGEKTKSNTISIDMKELWDESSTATFTIKSTIRSEISSSSGGLVISIVVIACVLAVAAAAFVIIKKKSLKKASDSDDSFENKVEDTIDQSNT